MSQLDRRFAALSDPTRRRILETLGQGEATVQHLMGLAPISQPAMSHHLKVLEAAGLIETRIAGTARPRRLRPGALDEVDQWLDGLRAVMERSYQRLDTLLEELDPDPTETDGFASPRSKGAAP